ncbi:MAG TPA: hypothetical protein VFI23_17510 [Rhizomicrobium sp.]|nr:hypothetical protein [Rhizomicrobium sp.]
MKPEAGSDNPATSQIEDGQNWLLDCLKPLGRAASIAAGAPWSRQAEYHGFRILTAGEDGAYAARVTHHHGREIKLTAQLKHHIEQASFKSPEEAMQHARFVIASGALNPLLRS